MDGWEKEKEILVNEINVNHGGSIFGGHGFLKWKPENGFQLKGVMEQTGGVVRTEWRPGSLRFRPKDLYTTVLLQPSGFIGATPRKLWFFQEPYFVIPIFSELSLPFSGLTFWRSWNPPNRTKKIIVKTVFRVTKRLVLPDRVEMKTSLMGKTLQEMYSASGMDCRGRAMSTTMWAREEGYLECVCALEKNEWIQAVGWRVPQALHTALSFCLGEVPTLIYSQRRKWNREFVQVNKHEDSTPLNDLSPMRGLGYVDKDIFVHLFTAFLRDPWLLDLSVRIVRQLKAAMKQDTDQGHELLVGTMLEAILRTYLKKPFGSQASKLSVQNELTKFVGKHGCGKEGNEFFSNAFNSFKRIRDRNAHPDWLTTESRYLSKERLLQTRNDRAILARLYGVMVLAMSGYPHLDNLVATGRQDEG